MRDTQYFLQVNSINQAELLIAAGNYNGVDTASQSLLIQLSAGDV